MSVKFGSARISENGTVNGQRGDQTGAEVMVQDGYIHRNGWRVLRAKSVDKANGLAFSMACACFIDNTGYSQADRYAIFFTGINTIPTNADCSSLVAWCVQNVGINNFDVNGFYTGNEIERLLGTGQFNEVKFVSLDELYTGDILVDGNGTAHTVIVTEGLNREWAWITIPFVSNCGLLKVGSKGDAVRRIQIYLNEYCNCNLVIDGDFGNKTKEALKGFQAFWGLVQDGVYGQDTENAMRFAMCLMMYA